MSVLYTVRCRFTDPTREQAWNEWYEAHIGVLLSVPGFLAAQRFHCSATVDDRPYLAMYEVAGPEVLTSEPYLAIWGFDEWRPLIDNWTRDISTPSQRDIDFATAPDAWLWAAFVSGENSRVERALDALSTARPFVRTATVTGLDRSCAAIAWKVLGDARDPGSEAPRVDGVEIAQAVYTPLTECFGPVAASGGDRR